MYQWRKFEFFEDKYGGKSKIPEEIKGKINCSSSGRGKVAVGCDDGTVSLLDRGLKFNYDFPAHSGSVLFLQQLKRSLQTLAGSRRTQAASSRNSPPPAAGAGATPAGGGQAGGGAFSSVLRADGF